MRRRGDMRRRQTSHGGVGYGLGGSAARAQYVCPNSRPHPAPHVPPKKTSCSSTHAPPRLMKPDKCKTRPTTFTHCIHIYIATAHFRRL